MLEAEDRHAGPRKGSLLALASAPASTRSRSAGPGSLLAVAPSPSDNAEAVTASFAQDLAAPDAPPAEAVTPGGARVTRKPAAAVPGGDDAPHAPKQGANGLLDRLHRRVSGWRSKPSGGASPSAARDGRRQAGPSQPAASGDASSSAATAAPTPAARAGRRQTDPSDNPFWKPLVDPVKVVAGIIRARNWIILSTIVGGLLGVFVALNTPKLYEATTEVLIDPRALNLVDRELLRDGLPSDATLAIVENQVRIMESGTVIDKVVERLSLADDPEFNGQGGGLSLRGLISDLRGLFSSGGASRDELRQAIAVGNLYDALTIERGAKTFVISIHARTQDAEKSALIANTLVQVFLETYGELQSDTAVRATEELTSRLDTLRAEVEAAERAVETFKAENEIIDPQGRLITDDEIVKLNEQLAVARARTIELNARAESIRDLDVDQVVGGTLPEELQSGLMTELRAQYASLRQEADRMAVRLGPRHPQRIAIEAQLEAAREQIRAEIRRINQSIQVDLRRAVRLEQDLASRLAQLKVRHGNVGADMVELRELERDAASKRAVYEAFLLRAQETGEQQALNTANVSVISTAHPPLLPIGPSRSTIAITFAVIGFMVGVAGGAASGAWRSLRENGLGQAARDRDMPAAHPEDGDQSAAASAAFAAPAGGRTRPRDSAPSDPASAGRAGTTDDSEQETDMMHPAYTDERDHYPPPQHGWYPQPPFQPYGPPAFHGGPQAWSAAPQGWMPQQPVWPPQHASHYPAPQAWHQAPAGYAPQGWAPPQPAWHGHMPAPQPHSQGWREPQAPSQRQQPQLTVVESREQARESSAIEEIRESLREFREAIRELSEGRKRRRYF